MRKVWFQSLARLTPAVALLTVLGCTDGGSGGSPLAPSFVAGNLGRQVFELCKYGSRAVFDVSINGGTATEVTLGDGDCQVVHTHAAFPRDEVTVTEHTSSAYTLDRIVFTTYIGPRLDTPPTVTTQTLWSTNTVTGPVSLEEGSRAEFYNVPAQAGCTYTQGGYKNTLSRWPSGYAPGNPFFTSGKTWLQMYNTAPKGGDVYVKLAHQWMTAVMNVANGATASSAVQAAITGGTSYFTGSSYSNAQLLAWHDLLDSFNNGNQGPAHCDQ